MHTPRHSSVLVQLSLLFVLSATLHSCKKEVADAPVNNSECGTTLPAEDQSYTVTALSAYEEFGKRIIKSNAGDYIVIGTRYGVVGSSDILLMRVNPANGDFTSSFSFGGANDDAGCDLLEMPDNTLLIAGITASSGAGQNDFYLTKTTSSGSQIWDQTYGGSDMENLTRIKATPDGNYMLLGFTESFGNGSRDIYVVKVDPNGTELWSKTFGGANQDGAMDMVHNGTNWMILGFTYSFGAGDNDMWLLEMNSNGDSITSQTFGGPGYEEAQTIIQTNDGGYLLHGHSASNEPAHNMFSAKINSAGTLEWQQEVGETGFHDGGEAAIETNNSFYVLGNTASYGAGDEDVIIAKLSATGQLLDYVTHGESNKEFAKDLKLDGNHLLFTGYQLDDIGQRKVYVGRIPLF